MSQYTLQPAVKYVKPMKLFFYGPSWSGKTYSAIKTAVGIVMKKRGYTDEADAYKHILLIDSEFGRGALYQWMGDYNYFQIQPPYHTTKLVKAMAAYEVMDQVDVIINDSLTHYWSKSGGILDQKAQKDRNEGGNSYANWQEFTMYFNEMIDKILESPKHTICTARSKNDTVLDTSSGKSVPKTYGLKPELREGIEYDFDISFNVEKGNHNLLLEKGLPGMQTIYPAATPALGMELYDLFNADAVVKQRTDSEIIDTLRTVSKENNMVTFMMLELSGRKLDDLKRDELLVIEEKLYKEITRLQTDKAASKKRDADNK